MARPIMQKADVASTIAYLEKLTSNPDLITDLENASMINPMPHGLTGYRIYDILICTIYTLRCLNNNNINAYIDQYSPHVKSHFSKGTDKKTDVSFSKYYTNDLSNGIAKFRSKFNSQLSVFNKETDAALNYQLTTQLRKEIDTVIASYLIIFMDTTERTSYNVWMERLDNNPIDSLYSFISQHDTAFIDSFSNIYVFEIMLDKVAEYLSSLSLSQIPHSNADDLLHVKEIINKASPVVTREIWRLFSEYLFSICYLKAMKLN